MADNPDQPVKDHFQVRLIKIWKIISKLDHLCSLVREIPKDDLKPMNELVEDIKTHTFGVFYFISDPMECPKLRDSVFGVTKDGGGHTQHFRNVFKETDRDMRVIQVKDSLYPFVPDIGKKEVRVHRYEKICYPKQLKITTLQTLSGECP